jgi:hypothetical protein
MIKVRPYRPGDAYFIDPIEAIFQPIEYMKAQTDSLALSKGTEAHTVFKNGYVIAIFGVTMIWPGVLEVWSILSDEIKEFPMALHRGVKRKLEYYKAN